MQFLSSPFVWLAIVVIVAILANTVRRVVGKSLETRRYVADAGQGGHYKALAEEATALNRHVAVQLDDLNARLAAIEKAIADLP
ncbi:MAG TPA: hypothetical protein VGC18_00395 [Lacisediminihabitans sp.]|uniref:hypothetical protein n=1 Tax=Lacisediminihabitans sp. TaxID=2787631 RepID=UPI002ED9EA66